MALSNEHPFPSGGHSFRDVISDLRGRDGVALEYAGTSVGSHVQSEPILYGPDGRPLPPASDWEIEFQANRDGLPSRVTPPQNVADFPRFLPRKEAYINRSQELGDNMLRISFDFARLCPSPFEFNQELMEEYIKALALIRARGMEPMVTLHHFTMPTYLLETDRNGDIRDGGWEHPEVARHFRFYIENVFRCLADTDQVRVALRSVGLDKQAQDRFLAEGLAKYFMSFNEPAVTLFNSYIAGVFPPYKRGGVLVAKQVLGKMVEAHDMVLQEAKGVTYGVGREVQVGVGYNWQYFDGFFGGAVHEFDEYYTDKFERNGTYSDFLGLHYYFRMTLPLLTGRKGRAYGDHPAFGDIHPEGVAKVLQQMHKAYPQKEIFVSEFGFSDAHDQRRPYWILETVRHILLAKRAGVPVKGMLLWSLVNNFEWDLGMTQKFGLFEEKELFQPLKTSKEGVRSWEVWRAAMAVLSDPAPERLDELERVYGRAQAQYQAKK